MDNRMIILNIHPLKKRKFCHETTWMNLENIMLSEINQIQKDKYRMISLVCGI